MVNPSNDPEKDKDMVQQLLGKWISSSLDPIHCNPKRTAYLCDSQPFQRSPMLQPEHSMLLIFRIHFIKFSSLKNGQRKDFFTLSN